MKLFYLLFLVITLITLQKITAKEIGFADNIYGHLFIDSQHACTLKSCRYNDAGIVFCEVYFDVTDYKDNCYPYVDNNKYNQPVNKCDKIEYVTKEHYRIRIDLLSVSGKCNLSKTNKFKDTKLLYTYNGKDDYGQLFANCKKEVSKGYLPSSYKNLRYYFSFKTSENCTFKGYFNKIKAYKV